MTTLSKEIEEIVNRMTLDEKVAFLREQEHASEDPDSPTFHLHDEIARLRRATFFQAFRQRRPMKSPMTKGNPTCTES